MQKKNVNKKRVVLFIIFLVIIIGAILIIYMNKNFIEFQNNGTSLMSLEGYKQIEVDVSDNTIALKDNCRAILVTVPDERAHNLGVAKFNITEERPSIYDSTLEIIKYYDVEFGLVKIEKLENNIYYSKVLLNSKDKILYLDMRPSDAMVLALRLNKPIYINEEILDNNAVNIC